MPGAETPPGRPVLMERPGVGWLVAALALVLVLLVASALVNLAAVLGAELPDPENPGTRIPAPAFLLVIALSCLSMTLVAGVLLLFYRGIPRLSFPPRFLIHTAAGLAGVWLVNLAGTWLMERWGEAYRGAPGEAGGIVKAGILLLAVLVAPAVEELFFREILLARVLARHPAAGAVATSIAFGLFHSTAGGLLLIGTLTAMGAILAWLRLSTRSLGPPLVAHSLNNLLVLFSLGAI